MKMMRHCNNELYAYHDGMTDDRVNARVEERREQANGTKRERGRERERLKKKRKKFCFSLFETVCLVRWTFVCMCM